MSARPRQARSACRLLVLLAAVLAGCAGHSDRTKDARSALDAGRASKALELYDEELDVDRPEDLPEEFDDDDVLLILDRAIILQALDRYELSSRDLELADKSIEVLDFSRSGLDSIGKYMFSDDVGPYQAPPYEKLLINTMNMINYLVRGDLNGARVEARRLAVMQKFIEEHEGHGKGLTGPGSYLAGFTFEKSGEPGEALRYYDEALQFGDYVSLAEPVRRLSQRDGYRSPRLRRFLGEPGGSALPPPPSTPAAPAPVASTPAAPTAPTPVAPPPTPPPTAPASTDDSGEILVIISYGRVPAKVARRVPIGLALTIASSYISPYNRSRAAYLAGQGLVTWINYPTLGRSRGQYEIPQYDVDGRPARLEGMLAVDLEARKAWKEVEGSVVASAITRMITRIVAGEVTRRASGGGVVGALLSLGTQATLTATDTPDTRSWATLPARIAFGRVRVRPGRHVVTLESGGLRKRQTVQVAPRGWAVVNLTVLR